jgi:hypothetical protein
MLKDMQVSSGERPERHKSISLLKSICDGQARRRCGYVVAQASGKEAVIHAYAACKPVLVPR